jgi:ABC-type sugar transport system ATPase subunit
MTDLTTGTEPVAIHVHEALKRYGSTDKAALDRVTLEIRPGELLAVLGPSGSGKTTMLNVLAGLESVNSGRVLFGEEDVTALAPEERGVGVVFQSSMLYPHLSLRDSISFAPRLAKVPRQEIDRRIEEVTTWLNITHLLRRRPGQVSGGERQRAAIAKALVTRPRLLLMDEPFSAVDAQLRRQLRTELVKLHRSIGTTTVFVTHDQEEAMSIADRVAVMRNGELVQVGTPLELYRRPVSSWLADFVSTQPLNLFDAHVDGAGRIVLLEDTRRRLHRGRATRARRPAPGPGGIDLAHPDPGDAGLDRQVRGVRLARPGGHHHDDGRRGPGAGDRGDIARRPHPLHVLRQPERPSVDRCSDPGGVRCSLMR